MSMVREVVHASDMYAQQVAQWAPRGPRTPRAQAASSPLQRTGGRRIFVAAWCCVFVLAFSLLLTGCSERPIRVGFAGSLTGTYSDLGVQGRNAAQLAVESINARGGVLGQPLELLAVDDKGSDQGAREAVRTLLDAGVVAIVGHMTSSQSVASLDVVEQAGGVMLSPTTSTPSLSGLKDAFFRVQPATDHVARQLAEFAYRRKGSRLTATLRDVENDAYTRQYTGNFIARFQELGGEVVLQKEYSSSSKPDWTQLGQALLQSGASDFFVAASALDTVSLLHTLRAAEFDGVVYTSMWGMTEALFEYGGDDGMTHGLYGATTFYDSDAPAYREFKRRYKARFGRPASFAAAQTFDAITLLAAALEQTRGRREGLEKALTSTAIQGLQGVVTLDEYGDASHQGYILEVREGRLDLVESPSP